MKVYKFGGTSLAGKREIMNAASVVGRGGRRAVVVVSATAGTTDALFEAARKARGGGDYEHSVLLFEKKHKPIAQALGCEKELADMVRLLRRNCWHLERGVQKQNRVVARMVALGELLSSVLFTSALRRQGYDAVRLTPQQLGMLTEGGYLNAEFSRRALSGVGNFLQGLDRIAVIPGFLGVSKSGETTTLGRGGSDYSAAFLAAAVAAEELLIYTDVEGIMTADPKTVPDAETVPQLSYSEAAELSYFGAKVLHPRTIEPAVSKSIPICVKNSFNPESAGTRISPRGSGRAVAAIAYRRNIDTLVVTSTRMLDAFGFLARIFDVMRKHSICVDVVATSEVSVSMTVDPSERLADAVEELRTVASVEWKSGRAVVCVVGEKMRGSPTVVSRIFRAVAETDTTIEMVSQGASRINLTFVIRDGKLKSAVRALHKEFFGR